MTWALHHHDARRVSEIIAPESVDLVCTSPPYYKLRDYRDGGASYDGQIGSEQTPDEFLDILIDCTRDWMTTVKPTGSIFVNLGDSFAGSGGYNNSNIDRKGRGPSSYRRHGEPGFINPPPKSRYGMPWRYALRCIDELGLTLRADICWSKVNGLPESVTDRVRISHEYLFHFTKQGRYFAAIDEVREPQVDPRSGSNGGSRDLHTEQMSRKWNPSANDYNPLGKVPGSVWQIASEPLIVPDELGVDHFAAFPSELPRRCILGWTPSGWCVECGEARRPVVDKRSVLDHASNHRPLYRDTSEPDGNTRGLNGSGGVFRTEATIIGYACACSAVVEDDGEQRQRLVVGDRDESGLMLNTPVPDEGVALELGDGIIEVGGTVGGHRGVHGPQYAPSGMTLPPTRPAVVLDPFSGTSTTVLVADQLGRHGIGVDLSRDYLRLGEWRIKHDVRTHRKVRERSGLRTPEPPAIDGQLDLFGEASA